MSKQDKAPDAAAENETPAASENGAEPGAENGAAKPAAKKKKKASKGKSLVIVESPAKARTINKYLGDDFVVKASMGHIRDLPKGKFGIDMDEGFTPEYQTIRGKGKVISELKKLAKTAPLVWLAPDLDREGEAIAWHLAETLEVPPEKLRRVVFNEITKKAIQEAFERFETEKFTARICAPPKPSAWPPAMPG